MVTTTVPTGSGNREPSGSRDSSSSLRPKIATAMPIGTLMTKTERQPHASTKSPPMVGPSAAASAPAAPQSAMACGILDLGNACRISASDAGVSAAAPIPAGLWRQRARRRPERPHRSPTPR